MSEGRPVCSKPGGWFEIAGHPVGYSAVEGAVKAISVLVMICYLRWNRWRASRGHLSAAQTLIFPIYGYIIYMVGFIDLAQAIVLEVSTSGDTSSSLRSVLGAGEVLATDQAPVARLWSRHSSRRTPPHQ